MNQNSRYDFDKVIDRKGTGALKCDQLVELFGRDDLLPLWIADMDFPSPDFVIDAIKGRLEHPVLGYCGEHPDFRPAVVDWMRENHSWHIRPEWLAFIPGIVKGIGMAINVFVKPDEKVVIQPPVYHPFHLVPERNHREVVYNPLILNDDGSYSMDFDNLAEVVDDKCRMLILCNPHNPGGTIWDADTLRRLAAFCHEHHMIVVSDEIHSDLTLWGRRHVSFATVSDEAAACSITFGAPSKTFNIPGMVASYAIVPDSGLRTEFFDWLEANELSHPDIFATLSTVAAYRKGAEWHRQVKNYIEGNIEYIVDYCARHIPTVRPVRPEASFLVWLDCRALGLDHDRLIDLFVNKARLALNDGEMFGKEGRGFMRLNVAEPRCILEEAMRRLDCAVNGGHDLFDKVADKSHSAPALAD